MDSATPPTDPFLVHNRLNVALFESTQTLKQAKTKLDQKISQYRANPALREKNKQELNGCERALKKAEDDHKLAEEQCAASLRSLFHSLGGGVGGTDAAHPRPSSSTHGDDVEHDSKPNVSFIHVLELQQKLQSHEDSLNKINDQLLNVVNAFSSIHDTVTRIADLAQTAYHPGNWSGPGSHSETPLQRTAPSAENPQGLPPTEPILAIEDETLAKRISKTHLGILFSAVRRGTESEHGAFQFIPYDTRYLLPHQHQATDIDPPNGRARGQAGEGEGEAGPPPAEPVEAFEGSEAPEGITPFGSPTSHTDTYTMARRIDRLGADLLEVAFSLCHTQKVLEFDTKHRKDDRELLDLALLAGSRNRADLAHLVDSFLSFDADEMREGLVNGEGGAGDKGANAAHSGRPPLSVGMVAAASNSDVSDDQETAPQGLRQPAEPQQTGVQRPSSPSVPPSSFTYRVKPEPED
ncbi:unnamed protein product [Tilletia controversa]|nr:unnamed protein product [Tilletia controversa]